MEEREDELDFAGNFYICLLPRLAMMTSDSNSHLHNPFPNFTQHFLLVNCNMLIGKFPKSTIHSNLFYFLWTHLLTTFNAQIKMITKSCCYLTWSNQLSFNWRYTNPLLKRCFKSATWHLYPCVSDGSFLLGPSSIPFLMSCDLSSELFYLW